MINMDKKYKTRDGRDVRILCVDADTTDKPVVALVHTATGNLLKWYSLKGETGFSPNDLIEVKEKKTITKWLNIYKSNHVTAHSAKEIANEVAIEICNHQVVACVPITIEYTEGEGLE